MLFGDQSPSICFKTKGNLYSESHIKIHQDEKIRVFEFQNKGIPQIYHSLPFHISTQTAKLDTLKVLNREPGIFN